MGKMHMVLKLSLFSRITLHHINNRYFLRVSSAYFARAYVRRLSHQSTVKVISAAEYYLLPPTVHLM